MSASSGASSQLLELAVRLARLHGFLSIAAFGPLPWAAATLRNPDLDLVEFRLVHDRSYGNRRTWSHRVLTLDAGPRSFERNQVDLGRSVIVVPDVGTLDRSNPLEGVPVVLLAAQDRHRLDDALQTWGVTPTFVGRLGESHAIAIIDRTVASLEPAPDAFRVTAVMTTFNEEDVIRPSIEKLLADGVGVHLIDNWSSDATWTILERYKDNGLVAMERFPQSPTSMYDWTGLLRRVELVASRGQADWYIHHDADERRNGPWAGRSLRDAIWTVDQSGFNAVDHTVLEFAPVDDGFVPGSDFEDYFRYFEFGLRPDSRLQIKAWKNTGQRVGLAESGGHEAAFIGREVFPYKFLLKHYPIRSQQHGERKILIERQARWNPQERAKGWHLHYDNVSPAHVFLRNPEDLDEFVDGSTVSDHLLPIIAGVGLVQDPTPDWALRSPRTWATYGRLNRMLEGRKGTALRRSRLVRLGPILRIAKFARRKVLGNAS